MGTSYGYLWPDEVTFSMIMYLVLSRKLQKTTPCFEIREQIFELGRLNYHGHWSTFVEVFLVVTCNKTFSHEIFDEVYLDINVFGQFDFKSNVGIMIVIVN